MQIRVNVDRAEALRRGFATANNQVVVELDLESLSEEQRTAVADRLAGDDSAEAAPRLLCSKGLLSGPILLVDEPTQAGVLAAIVRRQKWEAEIEAKAEAERKQEYEQVRSEALEVLRERRTAEHDMGSYRVKWRCIKPDWPLHYGDPKAKAVESVKELPEAQAWIAELDAENERRAKAASAEYEAAEARKRAEREEEERRRQAGRESLRKWATSHGSPLLRARVAHEADDACWDGLARQEWAQTQIEHLGLAHGVVEVQMGKEHVRVPIAKATMPEGYEAMVPQSRLSPSLHEMQALDGVRHLIARHEMPATAKLVYAGYAMEQDSGDGEEIWRGELRITITTPDFEQASFHYTVDTVGE